MSEFKLEEIGGGAAYLKAGFLGFPKSGKTWTATLLALGVRKFMGLKGPIVFFDTEGGVDYVSPLIKKDTGKLPLGIKSRAFDDLMKVGRAAESQGASCLIVDSITHVWRELCNAYMKGINDALAAKGKPKKNRMDIQDIMRVKELWSAWPDFYLNSKLHIIICGRAGFEWGHEENEETGKKELVKTGVKMKVESEFGFEPSLLVQMEREQDPDDGAGITHVATVIGDRFSVIDAKQCANPTFDFFKPHVAMLTGTHTTIKTETSSQPEVDDNGNTEWQREKRERTILSEEIQSEMLKRWPGMTASDKKAKVAALEQFFGTSSWTKVSESMDSHKLRSGLEALRAEPIPVVNKTADKAEKETVPA